MPTLHVTNWSSRKLHGPGRRFTIMAAPRDWEHGEGRVPDLTPELHDLRAVQQGHISPAEYEHRFRQSLEIKAGRLGPDHIYALQTDGLPPVLTPLRDGDTLCCACSRDAASRSECHRTWAAEALAKAGWTIMLDGKQLELAEEGGPP